MARKSASSAYGYFYGKNGQIVTVSAPITASGKRVKKHTQTQAGGLGSNVGHNLKRA